MATEPLLSAHKASLEPETDEIARLERRYDIQAMSFGRYARMLAFEDAVSWDTFEIAVQKYEALTPRPGLLDRGMFAGLCDEMAKKYPYLAVKKR